MLLTVLGAVGMFCFGLVLVVNRVETGSFDTALAGLELPNSLEA